MSVTPGFVGPPDPASLSGTLSGMDVLSQIIAAQEEERKRLAEQTANANQQASTAQQQYQQAAAAPPPDVGAMQAFLPTLLGNVASVLGQNSGYAENAHQRLKDERSSLLQSRADNLAQLRGVWNQKAEAAQKAGDLETTLTARQKSEQLSKTYDGILQQQRLDAAQTRAETTAQAAENRQAARDKAADLVPTLDENTLNMVADNYAVNGNAAIPPGGRGPERQKFVNTILSRAAQRHPGINLATTQADFASDRSSLKNLRKLADVQSGFIRTLDANVKMAENTLAGLPETGTTFGNYLARGGAKAIGSRGVAKFDAAMQVVRSEASRILGGGLTGGAVVTDSQRKELEAMAGNDFTKDQLRDVLALIQQDSKNKQQSYSDQITEIQARLKNAGNAPTEAGAPAGTAPSTHRYNPATGKAERVK